MALALVVVACTSENKSTGESAVLEPPTASPTSAPEASTQSEPAVSQLPEAEGWAKADVSPEVKRADSEDCYAFSRAVVDRDQRISDDRRRTVFGSDSDYSMQIFHNQSQRYGDRNTFLRNFEDCMAAKGYVRE
jgi:hypothetical protein